MLFRGEEAMQSQIYRCFVPRTIVANMNESERDPQVFSWARPADLSFSTVREVVTLAGLLFWGARFSALAHTISKGRRAAGVKRLIPKCIRRDKLFDAGMTGGLD